MVLALVGSIGVTSSRAAIAVASDNFENPGTTNLFGLDEAQNGAGAITDKNKDVGMSGGIDLNAGDRWSPYPPYHHNDL